MQIVRDLAGYTYGMSDVIRRAMGKKKMDVMLMEKEYFINGRENEKGEVEVAGCVRNGIPREVATGIFDQMVSFAEYAFNKSHAAAYAVIAYETAYLKTHYPVEFMAALMTSFMGDAPHIARYIRNCTEMGISVLPPSVCDSEMKFTAKDGNIRFGLLGVKNVGENAVRAIVNMRNDKGKPKDIFQFINNISTTEVNKKAVESLIKAGAFHDINENRAQLLASYESLLESAQNTAKRNIQGQISLFQSSESNFDDVSLNVRLPDVKNFSSEKLAAMEKEMLGVYITGHPLDAYEEKLKNISGLVSSDELLNIDEGSRIFDGMSATMAGIISSKKTIVTKSSKMMAFVDMEDLYGNIEVIVFPNIYERYLQLIQEDAIVVIKGSINFKEEEMPKMIAEHISGIETLELLGESKNAKEEPSVKLRVPYELDEAETLEKIKKIALEHRGDVPIIIYFEESRKKIKTSQELWVNPNETFKTCMYNMLGKNNVKFDSV